MTNPPVVGVVSEESLLEEPRVSAQEARSLEFRGKSVDFGKPDRCILAFRSLGSTLHAYEAAVGCDYFRDPSLQRAMRDVEHLEK
jgi:hypothetical protein